MSYETKQKQIAKEMQDLNGRLENFTKSKEYSKGYSDCKKEYEEKLRWIPIEEKLPETREYSYQILVRTKSSDRGSDLYRTVAIFSFDTQPTIERKIRGYIGWRYFL